MIDLGFLTEEEQEAIMKVLSRDAELKKADEERVRHLEETVNDDSMLKNMSGQWFYEAKSKRHREKIHGADIIRASIRKKKPQTIAELSESKADKAKNSWVNNVNRDIFVPPELFGVIEEPEKEEEEGQKQDPSCQSSSKVNVLAKDKPKETLITAPSPVKQRKNPFNDSTLLEENFALENQISENGTVNLRETSEKNTLSSVENVTSKNVQNSESQKSKNSRDVANGLQRSPAQPPIPKARTIYQVKDAPLDSDRTIPKSTKRNDKNGGTGARKGILKRNSSSSSTDSEILRIGQNYDTQNKTPLPTSPILEGVVGKNSAVEQSDESSQNGLDRLKHVRFSSNISQKALVQAPELHKGKELGEYDLLESDLTKNELHGLNEIQNEPGGSKSSFVSESCYSNTDPQTITDVSEDGHGLPKHMLPSSSQSSAIKSAVNISEDKSEFSNQSLERDPNFVADIPQDRRYSERSVPSKFSSSAVDAQPAIDVPLQEHSPSSSYNTDQPHLSVGEISQQERSSPAELASQTKNFNEISADTNKVSAETLPDSQPAQLLNPERQTTKFSVDQQPTYAETNKSPQVSKPSSADLQQDQQPIYAEIKKSPQVPKPSPTDLQQGKPALIGDYSHEAASKPDKYAIEFMKATDESVSKVLDWFNKSSETGDDTAFQGNETTEETYSPLKTEANNLFMGNTRVDADSRIKSSTQEQVASNATDNNNQLHSSENTHWRGELMSFGNSKNGGGKSRNVDNVDLPTESETEEKNVQPIQKWESQDTVHRREHLLSGKNNVSEDKIYDAAANYSVNKLQESHSINRKADLKSFKERRTMNIQTSEDVLKEPNLEGAIKTETSENKIGLDGHKESVEEQPDDQEDMHLGIPMWRRPRIFEQSEFIQPLKTVDASQEKRRVSDMKSFWEGGGGYTTTAHRDPDYKEHSTFVKQKPNQDDNESSIVDTNSEYFPNEPQDPSKYKLVTFKKVEVQDEEQPPSSVTYLKSLWEKDKREPKIILDKPRGDSITDKSEKTMAYLEGKTKESAGSPTTEDFQLKKTFNVAGMSTNFEKRNEPFSPLKADKASASQQKANFNVFSLKERLNEEPKDHVSNPSQFQNLRHFWNVGNKPQEQTDIKPPVTHSASINTSIPSNVETKEGLMEAKETVPENVQASLETRGQNQLLNIQERVPREEKYESSSRKTVQPDQSAPVDSMEKEHSLSKEMVKTEEKYNMQPKSDVKTYDAGLEKLSQDTQKIQDTVYQPINAKGKSNEKDSGQLWCTPENMMQHNQIVPTDVRKGMEPARKEVAETVEKATAPSKAELNLFNVALLKLEKEATETSNRSITSKEPSQMDQRKFYEKVMERSHNESSDIQKEREARPSEVRETVLKTDVSLKTDFTKFNSSLEKLHKEASETPPPSNLAAVSDSKIQQNVSRSEQQWSFEKEMQSCSTDLQRNVVGGSKEQTVEKTMALPKAEHSAVSTGRENVLQEVSKPSRASCQNVAGNQSSCDSSLQPEGVIRPKDHRKEREYSQEVREVIEKTISLPKTDLSNFDISLAKLQREASELSSPLDQDTEAELPSEKYSPPDWEQYLEKAIQCSPNSINCQKKNEALPQEIEESIEKTIAPSKPSINEFNISLDKLQKEVARAPSLLHLATTEECKIRKKDLGEKQESPDDKMIQSSHSTATNIPNVKDYPIEVTESVEKPIATEKAEGGILNTGLENLYKEASEISPTVYKSSANRKDTFANIPGSDEQKCYETDFSQSISSISQENITPSNDSYPEEKRICVKSIEFEQKDSLAYQQQKDLPREVNESVEKTLIPPGTESSAFKTNLEKLYQEVVEAASPVYQRSDNTVPSDQTLEPQKGLFIPNSMPTHLHSSQSHFQMMVPVTKENMKQNDEKGEEQSIVGAIVASGTTVSKVPKRTTTQNTPIHANVESMETPAEQNEFISKLVKEKETFEHEDINSSFNDDKESVDFSAYEHTTEGNASSDYVTESTPVKDSTSSIRRSRVELYLASPYQEDEHLAKYDDSSLSDGSMGSCSSTGRMLSRSKEELNPILSALKRSTAKSMPSKSLEDIPSVTSNQRKIDLPKEELVLSDEDDQPQETHEGLPRISTVSSFPDNQFSNPEKLKRLSQSVPAFLQEESDDRETDSTSESSFQLGRHKKSPSSLTNLSGSSGMASMSSVSGSVMSIYSGDFGNVDIKGNIQFAIEYVEQLQEFHIFVAQCKDLAVADVKRQRSDPYVKIYLLPDKAKLGKRKTAVKKKTLSPAYNKILRYKIDKKTLLTQKLNLSVWHNDTFGRNSFLGEVEFDLATWDWNNKQMNWYPLKPRTPAAGLAIENRGDMKIALKYIPQPSIGKKTLETGEVHIWVKECRGLPLLRGNRINSFVKCTVLPDTSRKSRQKTRSVEQTANPLFNHTMVYDGFRPEDLKEACIELTVWDHNRLAKHFLGGLRIGLGTGKSYGTLVDWMDSTIDEISLWEKTIKSPNEWVEDTLPLRMLMVAKMTK